MVHCVSGAKLVGGLVHFSCLLFGGVCLIGIPLANSVSRVGDEAGIAWDYAARGEGLYIAVGMQLDAVKDLVVLGTLGLEASVAPHLVFGILDWSMGVNFVSGLVASVADYILINWPILSVLSRTLDDLLSLLTSVAVKRLSKLVNSWVLGLLCVTLSF